jgi:hypothetical protein
MNIQLGPLELEVSDGGITFPHSGTPAANPDAGEVAGEAIGGLVTGPGGINVDLALVRWPGGVREMKTLRTNASPRPLDYASGRTTLFQADFEGQSLTWMYLDAVSPKRGKPGQWSTHQVAARHLDAILDDSAAALLGEYGAVAFGTGVDLRGDTSKVRNRLQVGFQTDNIVVPFIAFAITRQLALLRGFDKAKWGA